MDAILVTLTFSSTFPAFTQAKLPNPPLNISGTETISKTSVQPTFPPVYLLLSFVCGLVVALAAVYLYRRFSHHKLACSFDDHYAANGTLDEVTPLHGGMRSSSQIPSYGTNDSKLSDTNKKLSISHPIPLPRAPPTEDLLPGLHPLPPLPDLGSVVFETEARWRNFHHKRGLADSIIRHSTEPPLGRYLRMAVRSCLHMAEVSPECIVVAQLLHAWEAWGSSRRQPCYDRPLMHPSASFRVKYGHRHSKSTASIPSNHASLRCKSNDDYSSQGAMLMSEDSLRKKPPLGLNLPAALKVGRRAGQDPPPFVEVFCSPGNSLDTDAPCDTSDQDSSAVSNSVSTPDVPEKPKRTPQKLREAVPAKPSLKMEAAADEKGSIGRNRSVKFDDAAIGGSVLFGGKDRFAPAPAKPLLDRHFFTDETAHEWNLPNYGRIRFTDHAPVAFRLIRRSFGYALGDFDKALSAPFGSVTATAGKSEAIFFLTHNNAKFMFKTLRNSEPDNLKALLPDYLEHIRRNPNTLLPRYLGLYTFERLSPPTREPSSPAAQRVGFGANGMSAMEAAVAAAFPLSQQQTLPSSDEAFPPKMILVAMANVFDTPLTINERYDFKGSNVGRHTLPASATNVPPTSEERRQEVSHLTLKDLDFQYRVFQGLTNLIHLGPRSKQELMAQLEEDLRLLKRFALMDYSVLVGIHRPNKPKPKSPSSSAPSVRASRSGSIASSRNHASPLASPQAHASLIPPFFSSASNLLSSILLPNNSSPQAKEATDYFGECTRFPTGVTDSEDPNAPPIWQAGVRSVRLPNSEVYFIGIIDILQKYTIVKWLEKGLKGYNARLLGGVGTPTTPAAIPFPPRAGSTELVPAPPSECAPVRKYSLASSLPREAPLLDSAIDPPKDKPPEGTFKEKLATPALANVQRSNSTQGDHLTGKSTPVTPYPTPKSAYKTGAANKAAGFQFPQQTEHSVEEPGRYAERLLEYMRGIVVKKRVTQHTLCEVPKATVLPRFKMFFKKGLPPAYTNDHSEPYGSRNLNYNHQQNLNFCIPRHTPNPNFNLQVCELGPTKHPRAAQAAAGWSGAILPSVRLADSDGSYLTPHRPQETLNFGTGRSEPVPATVEIERSGLTA